MRTQTRTQVSIVVPTYEERENVSILYDGIRKALDGRWTYEVIFVDDRSPDGTGEVIHQLAQANPAIRLLERPGKLGLGSAVVDGFRMARGDYWVMMDADLSHRPQDLPGLLERLEDADIVVGSRYVEGGGVMNWPIRRRLISRMACLIGRRLTGLVIKDFTSGFVALRKRAIEGSLRELHPHGFKVLPEILGLCREASVIEAPIVFINRQRGKSKLRGSEVLAFLRGCRRIRNGTRISAIFRHEVSFPIVSEAMRSQKNLGIPPSDFAE